MSEITRALAVRVGVDLAKQSIQVHAVDAAGRRVFARALKRDQFLSWCGTLPPGCLVAMEACSGAHHWARKLRAMGLDARLIAANFVSPYRMEGKGGKKSTKVRKLYPGYVFIQMRLFGEDKSTELLVASQVCLSMQLGFACWPLMRFIPLPNSCPQSCPSMCTK